MSDGTVRAWGDNSFGQLGDGTTAERHIPVQVPGLTGITGIAAGGSQSFALKDGKLWKWGGGVRNPVQVNIAPIITAPGDLTTEERTPLTITLSHLTVTDPDSTWPDDFTLSVWDGQNYSRSGTVITPSAGFLGDLTVPVSVTDGIENSNLLSLTVTVANRN